MRNTQNFMVKYLILMISTLLISCGINQKISSNQKLTEKESNKILEKYGNVINLDYAHSTFSKLIFNDKNGNWNILKLSNGKKGEIIKLDKEPHFIGDSIIVEVENELKQINENLPFKLDGTTINFKYKYPNEIIKIHFNGEIEDFKENKFDLNYLNIIKEIIEENN